MVLVLGVGMGIGFKDGETLKGGIVVCVLAPANITELNAESTRLTVSAYGFALHPKFENVAPSVNTKARYLFPFHQYECLSCPIDID